MNNSTNNELLFAEERKKEILRIVNSNKKVVVSELVNYFKVSPATIRNDLRELENLGLILRTHGGAIPVDTLKVGHELEMSNRSVKNLKAKQQIAYEANKFIEDDDIIILDTGTTTLELAKLLTKRSNLKIIVNDIEIARTLEESDNQVILIGGILRKNFHCTVGPFATQMLSGMNVDKIFLGTNAFSLDKGCTTPDVNQAEIKKLMISISNRVYLLCDSSKIGVNSFVQFATVDDLDVLITDAEIQNELTEKLVERGIDVYIGNTTKGP